MRRNSRKRWFSVAKGGPCHPVEIAIIINLTFAPLFTKEIKDGFLVRVGVLGGSEGPFEGAFGLISGICIPSRIGTCEKKVAQSVDRWERKDPLNVQVGLLFPLFPAACSQYGLHIVLYRNLRVQSCTVLLQREWISRKTCMLLFPLRVSAGYGYSILNVWHSSRVKVYIWICVHVYRWA